jgi:AhpD family alkylhydroperoxidase
MKARIDYTNVPEALRGMYQLERYIHNSGLEESLVHLVKMRASQINGCAYCLDVHSKDARARGETEQRLYVLDAWEEAPFYSEHERAALAPTDAVTRKLGAWQPGRRVRNRVGELAQEPPQSAAGADCHQSRDENGPGQKGLSKN